MSKYSAPRTSSNVPGVQPSPLFLRNMYLTPDTPTVMSDPLNIPAPPPGMPLAPAPRMVSTSNGPVQVAAAPPPVIPVWVPAHFRGFGGGPPKPIPWYGPGHGPGSGQQEPAEEVSTPGSGHQSPAAEEPMAIPNSTMIAPPPVNWILPHTSPPIQIRPDPYNPYEKNPLVNPGGRGTPVTAKETYLPVNPSPSQVTQFLTNASPTSQASNPPPPMDNPNASTKVVAIAPAPEITVSNNAPPPDVSGNIEFSTASDAPSTSNVIRTMTSASTAAASGSNFWLWLVGGVTLAGVGYYIIKRRRGHK